ncbi:hypothetical protein Dimus_027144 [Dionaea muscipula]
MNLGYLATRDSSPGICILTPEDGNALATSTEITTIRRAPAPQPTHLVRMAMRISRSRWFTFVRRVFHHQNASNSMLDVTSNPFNSSSWMKLELIALALQISIMAITLPQSKSERPVWPMRIWIVSYGFACLISLLILYWRYIRCHLRPGDGSGLPAGGQQHSDNGGTRSLVNKCRTSLELFYAMWFVIGNVWMFDTRFTSFSQAPKLHMLCIVLLAWNAISYSFPFLLFVLLCICVPLASNLTGYNISMGSTEKGASDDEIASLPRWRYKHIESSPVS